jgi:hypothetical protein
MNSIDELKGRIESRPEGIEPPTYGFGIAPTPHTAVLFNAAE